MQITINGINYQLSFGLGFLKSINSKHPTAVDNVKVPYGALGVVVNSANSDPSALADILDAAIPVGQGPTDAEVESWIDQIIGDGTYHSTVESIVGEVLKSNTLKLAMGLVQKGQPVQNKQVEPALQAVTNTTGETVSPS